MLLYNTHTTHTCMRNVKCMKNAHAGLNLCKLSLMVRVGVAGAHILCARTIVLVS
jgi:hypothetical protein